MGAGDVPAGRNERGQPQEETSDADRAHGAVARRVVTMAPQPAKTSINVPDGLADGAAGEIGLQH